MSKSVGNVVDPFSTMERYGPDAARYFLAKAGGRFKNNVGASSTSNATPSNTTLTALLPSCNRRLVDPPTH